MHKKLSLICAIALLFGCSEEKPVNKLENLEIITQKGSVIYRVEEAQTPEELAVGLMNRDILETDSGMIFSILPVQKVGMWMQNTKIALDMIFIDSNGKIIHIAKDTIPYSEDIISSNGDVRAVLEINAGQTEKFNIVPGNMVKFKYFK